MRRSRLAVRLCARLLKSSILSVEDRTHLTTLILNSLQALPIAEIISFDDEGTLLISGKRLSPDAMISLRESVRALRSNYARKLLRDQITFEAVKMGVHQGLTPEMILFSKAALWFIQHQEGFIDRLDPLRDEAV